MKVGAMSDHLIATTDRRIATDQSLENAPDGNQGLLHQEVPVTNPDRLSDTLLRMLPLIDSTPLKPLMPPDSQPFPSDPALRVVTVIEEATLTKEREEDIRQVK
jgi:hypothetical protein